MRPHLGLVKGISKQAGADEDDRAIGPALQDHKAAAHLQHRLRIHLVHVEERLRDRGQPEGVVGQVRYAASVRAEHEVAHLSAKRAFVQLRGLLCHAHECPLWWQHTPTRKGTQGAAVDWGTRQCIPGLFCGLLLNAQDARGQKKGSQAQGDPLVGARVERRMQAIEPEWCL